MRKLTKTQGVALACIQAFIAEHGYSPSIRDIGAKLGVHTNAVQEVLNRLERDGYVSRELGKARTLRVLRGP